MFERTAEHLLSAETVEIAEQTTTKPLKMPAALRQIEQQRGAPTRLAVKCPECKELLLKREYQKNQQVCPQCQYHFRLRAHERLALLVDGGSFTELDADLIAVDPLHFVSQSQVYAEKLAQEREKVGINDAVVIGHATIEGKALALAVMDFHFIGGSMGSVVGEKITRAAELALAQRIPLLVVSSF